MKAPSLYFHFDSKAAIYDAMFEQVWTDCRDAMREVRRSAAGTPRQRLKVKSRAFFDFRADPPRPPPADEHASDPRVCAERTRLPTRPDRHLARHAGRAGRDRYQGPRRSWTC